MDLDYTLILKAIQYKTVDLRHDVDLSMDAAFEMAKLESYCGVNSTYYIRLDCDYYNPMSAKNVWRINEMAQAGHGIGLHIDTTFIEDEAQLIEYINEAKTFMPFTMFTFHINTDKTKGFTKTHYAGLENKSLVEKYISDSRGNWSKRNFDFIKNNDNFTLLIHPEWWMYKGTKHSIIKQAIKEILP